MEFLEEETRPKFLFQSRFSSNPPPEPEAPKINKPITFLCISASLLLSLLSIFFLQSETLISLILWFSLSLVIGPFAPSSITGGDIRVGQGPPLPPPDLDPSPQIEEPKKRRQKPRKPDDPLPPIPSPFPSPTPNPKKLSEQNKDTKTEETEWTDEDFELLKKQISRHPVGEPKRWELITEAFKGRHGMESVIKTAKSFSEKKFENGDSFSQFLKQRKPLDKRIEAKNDGEESLEGEKKQSEWSSGEDIALLNALKVFNKDVSMRWEKIAAAVPGKSKAGCMKRVAELKKDFRSSKASAE